MEKRLLIRPLEILIKEESKAPRVFTNDIKECKYLLLEKQYKEEMIRSSVQMLGKEEPVKIFHKKKAHLIWPTPKTIEVFCLYCRIVLLH